MSQKFTRSRADHLEFSFWLTFGADGSMSFSRGEPRVGRDQRSMSMTATIPKAIFKTPVLKGAINVAMGATEINVDVRAVSDVLSQALGIDVDLRVNP